MTNKQRAELESKLSLGERPEPPAGLAEKIKSEIPESFTLRPEGERFAAHRGTSRRALWQIAASLLLVLGVGYVALVTVREKPPQLSEAMVTERDVSAATAPQQEPQPQRLQRADDSQANRPESSLPPLPPPKPTAAKQKKEEAEVASAERKSVTDALAPAAPPPAVALDSTAGRENFAAAPAAVAEAAPRRIERGAVGAVVGGSLSKSDEVTVRGRRAQVPAEVVAPQAASTGGVDEPNAQPFGDVFFKDYGVNPFVDTEDDALSTFGLEVDTASYTIVRRYLRDGHRPPASAVRVEEMINYVDYGDRAPKTGDFALYAEGGPAPLPRGPRYQMLRFGIKAREIRPAARKPANLVFVIDVSGSMARENRLGLVKRALGYLVDELRPEDEVGIVVFNAQASRILEPTSDEATIREALEQLQASGSTNVGKGLILGFEMAWGNFRKGGVNRIILCSDGVANVGATDAEAILERIDRYARMGVELTSVGVGMGNFNDVLLEQMADKGDGRYVYVDTLEEARRVFVENLTGTLQTVAKDAKVQVEFNPRVVARYRLIGYENRDIADARFRDDDVDAGEIGAGHDVTALYEIKLLDDATAGATLATLRLRYESTETREVEEIERTIRYADFAKSWERAPRSFQLATLVASFGEVLKGSYWAKETKMDDLLRRARALEDDRAGAELVEMMERATD